MDRIDRRRDRSACAGRIARWAGLAALLVVATAVRAQAAPDPHAQRTRALLKELVEINTVTATGDTLKAAQAMAARLREAGFPAEDVKVLSPAPRKGNLVARLRGTGARAPILLLAHLDVVEARREDWTVDPFTFLEKDGYFYGRGVGDDKFMAAAFVANLIRWRQEGYRPDRDIIVALETDEETLDADGHGIRWLIREHRPLIDAEFALNEGGGIGLLDGKPLFASLQTSEKISVSYRFEVRNKGGHSSQPTPDNAIYRLSEALARLSRHRFPVRLNETTRAFFERSQAIVAPEVAADMKSLVSPAPDPAAVERLTRTVRYNAILRTTCVATMLEGGHAVNALPQVARAAVNCRILPDESAEDVRRMLEQVAGDPEVKVTMTSTPVPSPASPLNLEILGAVQRISRDFWPGIPVIPTMLAAATDGSYLRNAGIPTYGHSGLATDVNDVRAHGRDERVLVKSVDDGQAYLYRLVKALAGGR